MSFSTTCLRLYGIRLYAHILGITTSQLILRQLAIRNIASDTLAVAIDMAKRSDFRRPRVEAYKMIYDQAQAGFHTLKSEAIHGSLLAIRQLLLRSDEYFNPVLSVITESKIVHALPREER